MARIDLYPTLSSPPKDAKVGTGTAYSATDKFSQDVTVCNTSANPVIINGTVNISAPTGPYFISEHTVTTTSAAFPITALTDRSTFALRNLSTTDSIFVVNAALLTTAAPKWEIPPNETVNVDIDDSNSIFLVADTSVSIAMWEIAST